MTSPNPDPEVVVLGRRPGRTPLGAIELPPSVVGQLRTLIAISAFGAVLVSISVFLPCTNHEHTVHRAIDQAGGIPLATAIILSFLAAAAYRWPRHGPVMGWAIAGSLLALVTGLAGITVWLASYFDHVDSDTAQTLYTLGTIAELVGCGFGVIVGPPAFRRGRRALEAKRPVVPPARTIKG